MFNLTIYGTGLSPTSLYVSVIVCLFIFTSVNKGFGGERGWGKKQDGRRRDVVLIIISTFVKVSDVLKLLIY